MTTNPRERAEEILRHYGVLFPSTVVNALAKSGVLTEEPDDGEADRCEADHIDGGVCLWVLWSDGTCPGEKDHA